jgi:hypothetical protein
MFVTRLLYESDFSISFQNAHLLMDSRLLPKKLTEGTLKSDQGVLGTSKHHPKTVVGRWFCARTIAQYNLLRCNRLNVFAVRTHARMYLHGRHRFLRNVTGDRYHYCYCYCYYHATVVNDAHFSFERASARARQ